jgi:glyoxylase-like metal-dependent hydrolase (beta-lactamase superfamily II)
MIARRLVAGFVLLLAHSAPGSAADEPALFDLQPVKDGVFAALARPRTPINCNAAVVVYDDGVLVVDTHSRPSSARALIAQIRTVTDKPVRYALNTHFHWDHAQGNFAYPAAFPRQVAVVSSEATRQSLSELGLDRARQSLEQAARRVEEVKKTLAGSPSAEERARLQDELAQQESYVTELRTMELVLPDLTFDRSMILHRKDRDIYLLFLGRGHTSGDVVAYLPKEKVVATGDLLHGWMPYMGDSYPPEWVATLDELAKLDFDSIIGGHGGVKPRSHLKTFRDYLAALIDETRHAVSRGETLEQAQASVKAALRPRFVEGMGGAPQFDGSIGANVAKVFGDLQAKRYP